MMGSCIQLFIIVILTGTTIPRSCNESHTTYRVVDSCPATETEVNERARIKDCDSLAKSQNCTDPSKFKYHCVINVKETQLVEVCAPAYFMLGYCPEYNVDGARIQDHHNRRCTNMSTPCPYRYISTDAYLFPECQELVQRNLTTSRDCIQVVVAYGATTFNALCLAAFLYVCIWRRKVPPSIELHELHDINKNVTSKGKKNANEDVPLVSASDESRDTANHCKSRIYTNSPGNQLNDERNKMSTEAKENWLPPARNTVINRSTTL